MKSKLVFLGLGFVAGAIVCAAVVLILFGRHMQDAVTNLQFTANIFLSDAIEEAFQKETPQTGLWATGKYLEYLKSLEFKKTGNPDFNDFTASVRVHMFRLNIDLAALAVVTGNPKLKKTALAEMNRLCSFVECRHCQNAEDMNQLIDTRVAEYTARKPGENQSQIPPVDL